MNTQTFKFPELACANTPESKQKQVTYESYIKQISQDFNTGVLEVPDSTMLDKAQKACATAMCSFVIHAIADGTKLPYTCVEDENGVTHTYYALQVFCDMLHQMYEEREIVK